MRTWHLAGAHRRPLQVRTKISAGAHQQDAKSAPIIVYACRRKHMWQHSYMPIGGSLGLSALAAVIPIIVLFVMLGALRKPAWMAATTALASALIVSLVAYGMPARLAFISTIYGAAYGLFPIAWVVFTSIML